MISDQLATAEKAPSLDKAKSLLRSFTNRALIEPGDPTQAELQITPFPNPELVAEFVFTYYLPHGKAKE